MKKTIQILLFAVVFSFGSLFTAEARQQEDCEQILGGDGSADILVCCGATYVMSGWHMSGGCLGANQGCVGSYANGCI